MYLLDTNHCSRAILKDAQVLNKLREIENDIVAGATHLNPKTQTQKRLGSI